MLQSTFFDRYKGILDKAYHAGDSDSTEFTIKLSEIEKKRNALAKILSAFFSIASTHRIRSFQGRTGSCI
jgi:hypothetical protein